MENQKNRPFSCAVTKLKDAGLRPTRQRIALAKLLFEKEHGCHITAENLHKEALKKGVSVSLATIYNTLNQFTESNLLREIVVNAGQSYFDSSTHNHHHYFYERAGVLEDIPEGIINIPEIYKIPQGTKVSRIDVIVRLKD